MPKQVRHDSFMTYQSVAGQFFPEDKTEQKEMVRKLLEAAKEVKIPGNLKGLIVPHAGWMYSGIVAAAGYKNFKFQISNDKLKNFKIILVGPSHREYFSGVKEGIFDHSVEVQIPFIKEVIRNANILPMVYADITEEDLAREIEARLSHTSLIVISSDLSHYYPYETAQRIDALANKYIPQLNIEEVEQKVEACGKIGILALMLLAKKFGWKGKLLDYRNSGDTAGEKDSVVGYGCYCFYV